MELQVLMDDPDLLLRVRMDAPLAARMLNAVGARFPSSLWCVPWVAPLFARVADTVQF